MLDADATRRAQARRRGGIDRQSREDRRRTTAPTIPDAMSRTTNRTIPRPPTLPTTAPLPDDAMPTIRARHHERDDRHANRVHEQRADRLEDRDARRDDGAGVEIPKPEAGGGAGDRARGERAWKGTREELTSPRLFRSRPIEKGPRTEVRGPSLTAATCALSATDCSLPPELEPTASSPPRRSSAGALPGRAARRAAHAALVPELPSPLSS